MNVNISAEKLQEIVEECYSIELGEIFPEDIYEILYRTSGLSGVSVEYLLPPLLASLGHLMSTSKIKTTKKATQVEGFVFYTALLGNPSTGKTPAINICKSAIYQREQCLQIKPEASAIANGATVEATIELLNQLGSILSFFDESNAFMGSLGRYSSNNSASYDRSVYLELFNAYEHYNRDLKCGRTRIEKPRFNLCLLGHPYFFASMIAAERAGRDDGLTQRFLLCCPRPALTTFDVINRIESPEISLNKIFFVVGEIHKKPREYFLTEDALKCYGACYSKFRSFVRKCDNKDAFLGAMFGKANTLILRMSGLMKAFKTAIEYLHNYDRRRTNDLEPDFLSWLEKSKHIIDEDINSFKVDKTSVEQSIRLVEYFNLHRLKLAGYSFTINSLDSIDHLFTEKTGKQITITNHIYDKCTSGLMWKIMVFPKRIIDTKSIATKTRASKDDIIEAFNNLQSLGLGKVGGYQASNRKRVHVFERKRLVELQEDVNVSSKLQKFGMTFSDLVMKIEDSEKDDEESNNGSIVIEDNHFENDEEDEKDEKDEEEEEDEEDEETDLKGDESKLEEGEKEQQEQFQINRPFKTKSTSFMVEQGQNKLQKTKKENKTDKNSAIDHQFDINRSLTNSMTYAAKSPKLTPTPERKATAAKQSISTPKSMTKERPKRTARNDNLEQYKRTQTQQPTTSNSKKTTPSKPTEKKKTQSLEREYVTSDDV